ncbi:accessory factor UbiK family protein [Nitrincola tapanii]|uniref:Ubiquinone biosynthesis accessory factor UbiK n=1 Tax=Nitrincola tapanii TaxID=1708751 RepID=A0A5A9W165_9GAMM|nr:accessory factor UbiK family protein [Nitrincola tapanii]KAA0874466.1 accessory factor UbiK family protein [Nitrincola tapanii]
MIPHKLAEGLSQQFNQLLSKAPELPGQKALQHQVQALLQQTFDRLDLVTREEFEAQKAVLLRTREKLEALEETVAQLEAELQVERSAQEPASD